MRIQMARLIDTSPFRYLCVSSGIDSIAKLFCYLNKITTLFLFNAH